MSRRLILSDTHIGHLYMAGLRGFASVEEHDETIIDNWNKVVRDDDTVIVPGDAILGDRRAGIAKFKRMHGRKVLITGNHDDCWPGHANSWSKHALYQEAFDVIQQFARITIDGRTVMISHFPYTADRTDPPRYNQYRLRDEGAILLHGHTHSHLRRTSDREIHVGADAWKLTPIAEHRIAAMIREQEQTEKGRNRDHAEPVHPADGEGQGPATAESAPAPPDGPGASPDGAPGHPGGTAGATGITPAGPR